MVEERCGREVAKLCTGEEDTTLGVKHWEGNQGKGGKRLTICLCSKIGNIWARERQITEATCGKRKQLLARFLLLHTCLDLVKSPRREPYGKSKPTVAN